MRHRIAFALIVGAILAAAAWAQQPQWPSGSVIFPDAETLDDKHAPGVRLIDSGLGQQCLRDDGNYGSCGGGNGGGDPTVGNPGDVQLARSDGTHMSDPQLNFQSAAGPDDRKTLIVGNSGTGSGVSINASGPDPGEAVYIGRGTIGTDGPILGLEVTEAGRPEIWASSAPDLLVENRGSGGVEILGASVNAVTLTAVGAGLLCLQDDGDYGPCSDAVAGVVRGTGQGGVNVHPLQFLDAAGGHAVDDDGTEAFLGWLPDRCELNIGNGDASSGGALTRLTGSCASQPTRLDGGITILTPGGSFQMGTDALGAPRILGLGQPFTIGILGPGQDITLDPGAGANVKVLQGIVNGVELVNTGDGSQCLTDDGGYGPCGGNGGGDPTVGALGDVQLAAGDGTHTSDPGFNWDVVGNSLTIGDDALTSGFQITTAVTPAITGTRAGGGQVRLGFTPAGHSELRAVTGNLGLVSEQGDVTIEGQGVGADVRIEASLSGGGEIELVTPSAINGVTANGVPIVGQLWKGGPAVGFMLGFEAGAGGLDPDTGTALCASTALLCQKVFDMSGAVYGCDDVHASGDFMVRCSVP